MAAAYVTGLAAYLIALEGPRDAIALCERIKELSIKDILTGVPSGTGNRLAFNGNPTG
jgi:oryzin